MELHKGEEMYIIISHASLGSYVIDGPILTRQVF